MGVPTGSEHADDKPIIMDKINNINNLLVTTLRSLSFHLI